MKGNGMRRGLFITLEGPEGGGKTTQARRLAGLLRDAGHAVLCTREPGGTAAGEMIRGILQHDVAGETIHPETETLLFAASRAHLVQTVILPALEEGTWVVCDRFHDSTTVYQGYGRGLPLEAIAVINAFAIGPACPDLTLLLDIAVEQGFERLKQRQDANSEAPDRIEQAARSFHQRVRAGYLDMAAKEPRRFRRVDASRGEEDVAAAIREIIRPLL